MRYFTNITTASADIYIYGVIVDEKEPDFWTGEISKVDVDVDEFRKELEEVKGKDLNIYINSPGGSVFAASTMVSLLKRFKEGNTIRAYIDGLCASAATYLLMAADEVNVYQNSLMMIHKPMTFSYGNATQLQKDIDTLNTIEDNTMIPMYMAKAKVTEEEIKELIADETWFSGNEADERFIGDFFEVNLLDEPKQVVACVSEKMLKSFKHAPDSLNIVPKQHSVDYSEYENILKNIRRIK